MELIIIDAKEEISRCRLGLPEPEEEYQMSFEFPPRWAMRPCKLQMYGHKHIRVFKEEIKDLFELGQKDSSIKKGLGRRLEVLRERYPNRFDLHSENEIQQEITKLIRKHHSEWLPNMQ